MQVRQKLTEKERIELTARLVEDTVAWAELEDEKASTAAEYREQLNDLKERIIENAKMVNDDHRMVDAPTLPLEEVPDAG